MQRSEQINELATALAAAQAEMLAAEMNAKNPFLKNRYADLGSIIEAIRPAIGKHGLSFMQLPSFDGSIVNVETLIMHASGQWTSSEMALAIEGEKGLSMAQVMGKAITYLRRYGLASMFGVYADKDDDGNDVGAESTEIVTKPAIVATGPVPNCPKCGGGMWDNRATKTKPTQPDMKCKNKDCDGVIWPPKPAAPPAEEPPASFDELVPAREDAAEAPTAAGKGKQVVIRTPKFGEEKVAFCAAEPYYLDKNGKPDDYHLLGAAVKAGFYEITDANIGAVWGALRQYAYEQQQLPKA